jgi:hypothetical protein
MVLAIIVSVHAFSAASLEGVGHPTNVLASLLVPALSVIIYAY